MDEETESSHVTSQLVMKPGSESRLQSTSMLHTETNVLNLVTGSHCHKGRNSGCYRTLEAGRRRAEGRLETKGGSQTSRETSQGGTWGGKLRPEGVQQVTRGGSCVGEHSSRGAEIRRAGFLEERKECQGTGASCSLRCQGGGRARSRNALYTVVKLWGLILRAMGRLARF